MFKTGNKSQCYNIVLVATVKHARNSIPKEKNARNLIIFNNSLIFYGRVKIKGAFVSTFFWGRKITLTEKKKITSHIFG